MAQRTGTLWENDKPTASCNHGFTSVFVAFAAEGLLGYKGYDVRAKKLIFSNEYYRGIDCTLKLFVNGKSLAIEIKNGERTINNGTDYQSETL